MVVLVVVVCGNSDQIVPLMLLIEHHLSNWFPL